MKKIEGILLSLLIGVICISFVSASVSVFGNNLRTSYSEGDIISGTINLKIQNENPNGAITSNFPGNSSLIDLLGLNDFVRGVDYNCTTVDCSTDYAQKAAIDSINLNSDENRILGFKLTGQEVIVRSLKLGFLTNSNPSCFRQFYLDVLNSGRIDFQNYRATDNVCSVRYSGCFNSGLDNSSYLLAEVPRTNAYCENITLPDGPAFKIGAKIKNSTAGDPGMDMSLFDNIGNSLGKCTLPKLTNETQEVSCVINYSSYNTANYFVCISAKGDSNYKIRTESSGNNCGARFNDIGSASSVDYEIFGNAMEYSFSNIELNETTYSKLNSASLANSANGYVSDKYDGDCSGNGCFVPIRINGKSQTINFTNVEIKYSSKTGEFTNNQLLELSSVNSNLNSGNLSVDIESLNFAIPLGNSQSKFILYLNGNKIFEKPINISKSFSFDVNPKIVLIGANTLFQLTSSENISSISWDFGDGSALVSGQNKNVSHIYTAKRDYSLTVVATRADGLAATKTFKISAANAHDSAQNLINLYSSRIANLSNGLNTYDSWIRTEIAKKWNIDEINSSLNNLKSKFNIASSEEDYISVVNSLVQLDVPYDISSSETGSMPIDSGFNNIDPSYIISLSRVKNADSDSVREAIISWMQENYNSVINYNKISSFGDKGKRDLVTDIRIVLNSNVENSVKEDYLIIDYPSDNIKFKQDYKDKLLNQGSAVYVPINSGNIQDVEFVVGESASVKDLGIYISP